jgi:ribose 5-phosphate isomerase B
MKKIFLGCDHAAFTEKEVVKKFLVEKGYEVEDKGTYSDERCNYPDYAQAVAKSVLAENGLGILICGSGIGVSIVANRYKGIRAALVRSPKEAELSRQHNDANVLCLGARITTIDGLEEISMAWLNAEFENGRHAERLALFENLGE